MSHRGETAHPLPAKVPIDPRYERGATPLLVELLRREDANQIRLFEITPEAEDFGTLREQCVDTLAVIERLDRLHVARMDADQIHRVKRRKERQEAARGWLLVMTIAIGVFYACAVAVLLLHGVVTGELQPQDLPRALPKL